MRSMGKPAIKFILENALKFDTSWTLQGLGMLRLTLSPTHRLHVWDSAYKIPGVTTIHTHPWDFVSHVIRGSITNTVYREVGGFGVTRAIALPSKPYMRQSIVCGPQGGMDGESVAVDLYQSSRVRYDAGQSYSEWHDEIHESEPQDGTVTLIERKVPEGGDPDKAFVYVPKDEVWGSAETRMASRMEIMAITQKALNLWT